MMNISVQEELFINSSMSLAGSMPLLMWQIENLMTCENYRRQVWETCIPGVHTQMGCELQVKSWYTLTRFWEATRSLFVQSLLRTKILGALNSLQVTIAKIGCSWRLLDLQCVVSIIHAQLCTLLLGPEVLALNLIFPHFDHRMKECSCQLTTFNMTSATYWSICEHLKFQILFYKNQENSIKLKAVWLMTDSGLSKS